MSILEARAKAQHIAFGPVVFQATRVLWKTGLLAAIDADASATAESIAEATGVSAYGVGVLVEMALSAGVLKEADGQLSLTKTGSMVLYDKMTQVNINFVHDVCYAGMAHLDQAIATGTPSGLSVFSEADTIYQCLTTLPEQVQASWYDFDHFYSDRAFKEAEKIVFRQPVASLMDIGGNTGKWARLVLERNPDVQVTIADLPGQLDKARASLSASGHGQRAHFLEVDLLAPDGAFPQQVDVVWMSQFLDCFSEAQIARILAAVSGALAPGGTLYIMETLVDQQQFAAAAYSLNATSLYFTAMANGNSRMYRRATFDRLLREQGYVLVASHDHLGLGHSLLECQLAATTAAQS